MKSCDIFLKFRLFRYWGGEGMARVIIQILSGFTNFVPSRRMLSGKIVNPDAVSTRETCGLKYEETM